MENNHELLQAFLLGNSSILTNTCLLPLYPGMVAFLSGNAQYQPPKAMAASVGIIVLGGILTMMMAVALLLYLLERSFNTLLIWVLPIVYAIVIILGLLNLLEYKPVVTFSLPQVPPIPNPLLGAYLYGLLLGPMTLPCTGPILTSALLLSLTSATEPVTHLLAKELLYFVIFSLGFGWPLVLMPLFALAWQHRFTRWITNHQSYLRKFTGSLLVIMGAYGIWTELLPNISYDSLYTP